MSFEFLGGRRLLLAGSRLGWFWILASAAAVILLVVLYREERRLVTRRAGLFLLCLRLSRRRHWLFALFEPIAGAARWSRRERGRVIVAVDVSGEHDDSGPGPHERAARSWHRRWGLSPARPSPGSRAARWRGG